MRIDNTKAIEVWGEYWHTGRWFHGTAEERILKLELHGVKTLILFGVYIDNYSESELAERVREFDRKDVSEIYAGLTDADRKEIIQGNAS